MISSRTRIHAAGLRRALDASPALVGAGTGRGRGRRRVGKLMARRLRASITYPPPIAPTTPDASTLLVGHGHPTRWTRSTCSSARRSQPPIFNGEFSRLRVPRVRQCHQGSQPLIGCTPVSASNPPGARQRTTSASHSGEAEGTSSACRSNTRSKLPSANGKDACMLARTSPARLWPAIVNCVQQPSKGRLGGTSEGHAETSAPRVPAQRCRNGVSAASSSARSPRMGSLA